MYILDFFFFFKGFNSNSFLVVHQALHTDVRSFSCSYEGCAWAFIHQSDCKRHISIHKGGSPHICSHHNCRLRFTAKHNLKAHEKLHTEKPYACRHGKRLQSFKSRAELTYHVDGHVKRVDSVLVWAASSDRAFSITTPSDMSVSVTASLGLGEIEYLLEKVGQKPYICCWLGCNKSFPRTVHCEEHIRSSHAHENPFKI